MTCNGRSISLAAQNKVLNSIDKLHETWDKFRGGDADQCEMMTTVVTAQADAKLMDGLVRVRHDDRMLITAKARLTCYPL